MSIFDKTKTYLIDLLLKQSNKQTALPKAIIMDVDDTLVSTINETVKFVKINKSVLFLYPGIKPMVQVAQTAKKLGYKIIILTARPRASFLSTKFNLDILEVPYDEIHMNNHSHDISFKYRVRQQLLKRYNVLFTVGDQIGDVNGPPGLLGIKLPSQDSYKVQIYSN
jgi:predicted secreted acid phosphatase